MFVISSIFWKKYRSSQGPWIACLTPMSFSVMGSLTMGNPSRFKLGSAAWSPLASSDAAGLLLSSGAESLWLFPQPVNTPEATITAKRMDASFRVLFIVILLFV